jgi:hypothetical protein
VSVPVKAFGRRPSALAAPSLIGPASETLHKSRPRLTLDYESASPSKADIEHLSQHVRFGPKADVTPL